MSRYHKKSKELEVIANIQYYRRLVKEMKVNLCQIFEDFTTDTAEMAYCNEKKFMISELKKKIQNSAQYNFLHLTLYMCIIRC